MCVCVCKRVTLPGRAKREGKAEEGGRVKRERERERNRLGKKSIFSQKVKQEFDFCPQTWILQKEISLESF